jgi:hypothetical protein
MKDEEKRTLLFRTKIQTLLSPTPSLTLTLAQARHQTCPQHSLQIRLGQLTYPMPSSILTVLVREKTFGWVSAERVTFFYEDVEKFDPKETLTAGYA